MRVNTIFTAYSGSDIVSSARFEQAVAGKTVAAFCVGGDGVPYKPKKPCAQRGCKELTTGRYCNVHAKETMTRYNKYGRDQATGKRYGTQWRKIRAAFLSAHPLCFMCQTNGKLTPASTVHHRRKLTDGGTHDYGNLMSLCASCHSSLHAGEGDYF